MKRKKVFVQGTPDSLQKFFGDAVSYDYDVIAILSDSAISVELDDKLLDVIQLQNLPKFTYSLIDGIIFTDKDKSPAVFFRNQGLEPRKIILWDDEQGWQFFSEQDEDGTKIIFLCGLEFHICNDDNAKFFNEIFGILKNTRYLKNLDPKLYPTLLAQNFYAGMGRPLNLDNPKTYTEKMQWMKLYDSTKLKTRLADKYRVRSWVEEKIGAGYSVPLLGVWDNFDDINFDELPDQFVLKCNHGSGMNIIVRDKKNFDKREAREKITAWLNVDYSCMFKIFELHYSKIERKVTAEKFIEDVHSVDLTDYKFWCFGGKPVFLQCETDRSTALRSDYFDMNFNHLDIEDNDAKRSEHPEKILKPKNFELMKELATKLSEGFAHVRVDFFEVNGRAYFAEMSFTPIGGILKFTPSTVDEYLGSLLHLPEPSPTPTY